MRTLALALTAVMLASPASKAEAMGYLAPRTDAAVTGSASQATPPEVETPGDWRRSALGNEATDQGHRSPLGDSS